jgi:ATP-dependent phosphofructokinase / diphosphate-dependent phosphofructokinase
MSASSSSLPRGTAVIGQSGGPTVVINQSLVGVVEGLRGCSAVEKVLGCVHGVAGIVKDQYIELQNIPQDRLDRVAQTPSSALGSSRDKPDAEYCKKIFQSFEKQNVRYFFYIGGNDSSDTCRIVNELARHAHYELRAFHVPKTIDNDLLHNDHTPGFGSAARFVACAFMGDNLDNRALPGVKIDIIMGRHAGFLTAASVLARQNPEDGPHLIYVPEIAFDLDKFLADVDRIYKKQGRCVIAVSEGIHDHAGTPVAVKLAGTVEKDAHGNVQLSGTGALGTYLGDLIKTKLKIKRVRADTFGYLQRSFAGCVSPTDAVEARAVGRKAAELSIAGERDGSISIQRVSDDPYRVEYRRIELADVAGKTRTMDRKFIVNDNNIHESFKDYLRPLVGPLPVIESLRAH